jgi:DinB superfamily
MYNLPLELIDALKVMPDTLKGLLNNVSDGQARSAKGGDENWSVVEVICHLRDAEEFTIQRVESMRDQDNPQIVGYNQAALARERKYNDADLSSAFNAFIKYREYLITSLSALAPEDWERGGEHNENGHMTIFSYILHIVSHDAIHCAQIARQLSAINN